MSLLLDTPRAPETAEAPTLTAFGREPAFDLNFEDYPVPPDLDQCVRLFRANCGPASFAALTGLAIIDIIQFFPHFPERPHTSLPQMKTALRACGIATTDTGHSWPHDGLCCLQICGPWMELGWPAAMCNHRHWISVRNGFVYEVNAHAWMSRNEWETSVMNGIVASRRHARGWSLLKALEVSVRPVSFPEFPFAPLH